MEEALKHGLKAEHVTYAHSYSNVIVYENGFVGVIGDSKLAAYGGGLVRPEPQTIVVAGVRDQAWLVPKENDAQFAPLLMAAVEARVASLDLHAHMVR